MAWGIYSVSRLCTYYQDGVQEGTIDTDTRIGSTGGNVGKGKNEGLNTQLSKYVATLYSEYASLDGLSDFMGD